MDTPTAPTATTPTTTAPITSPARLPIQPGPTDHADRADRAGSAGPAPSPAAPATSTASGATPHPLAHPMWAHAHTSRCWWDHRQAGWVCPPAVRTGDDAAPLSAGHVEPVEPAGSAGSSGDPATRGGVDVRDMLVVHTAMLRELRLLPAAVTAVADGDRRGAGRVVRHLDLVTGLLHHHHEGEDELLWPVLRPRLSADEVELLEVAEAQHLAIEAGLEQVSVARDRWVRDAAAADRDDLAGALRRISDLLVEHTEAEERHLLPLVAQLLTEAEWHAVGEAGAASVEKKDLPLVLGMFAYEGDPEVIRSMLASAPAVARWLVPRVGPRLYARRAREVHGTARP